MIVRIDIYKDDFDGEYKADLTDDKEGMCFFYASKTLQELLKCLVKTSRRQQDE